VFSRDLTLRQIKVLGAEGIDRGPLRFRLGKCGCSDFSVAVGKWHRHPLFVWDTLPIFSQE
jgi:hypothetical protein